MTIEFQCVCGKTLSVPDDASGRKAKCPSCGVLVTVPGETQPEPAPEPEGMMDQLSIEYATTRERAPQLVTFAIVLASTAGLVFLLSLIGAIGLTGWVLWPLVWVPLVALNVVMAILLIRARPVSARWLSSASAASLGGNYVLFWLSIRSLSVSLWGLFWMFAAMLNLGVCAVLFWTVRRGQTLALFEAADDATEPAKGPGTN